MTGTGTLLDPFIVSNASDLNDIRNQVDEYTYYELASDIDVSSLGHWTPIGTYVTDEFMASIDGKGYTISNMHITSSTFASGYRLGFLGYATKYAITSSYAYNLRNVTFESCSIYFEYPGHVGSVSDELIHAGIAIGEAIESTEYTASKIENVHVKSGSIYVTNRQLTITDFEEYTGSAIHYTAIGLLIGRSGGTTPISCSVDNSSIINDVIITQSGGRYVYVGGLVGKDLYSAKYNSVKNSTIQSTGWEPNPSYNLFDTASVNNRVGGFVGNHQLSLYTYDNYVYNCIVSGTKHVAGFAPNLVLNETAIGALGFTDPLSRIYTYVTFGNTPLAESFVFAETYTKQATYDSKDLYYQSESVTFTQSAAAIVDITGSTIAQMKNSASYENWDFANVWSISSNSQSGYPYLGWEAFPTGATPPTSYDILTILTPNGGERYRFGNTVPITWSVTQSYELIIQGFIP